MLNYEGTKARREKWYMRVITATSCFPEQALWISARIAAKQISARLLPKKLLNLKNGSLITCGKIKSVDTSQCPQESNRVDDMVSLGV